MKKIRKVKFNKERYNNVLELKPKEIEPVTEKKTAFMYNFYDMESAKRRALLKDDFFETDRFLSFMEKCEKELFSYIERTSETGNMLINKGTYDVGVRNLNNILRKETKRKTMQKITPKNDIIEFFHAALELQAGAYISRYISLYSVEDENRQKEMYKDLMLTPHDFDEILETELFSIEQTLCVDYQSYKKKKRPQKNSDNDLKVFASKANALFSLYETLNTEDIMPWNKDYNGAFGLYPLLNTIWFREVKRLYIDMLLPPNLNELNNRNLELGYFADKIERSTEGDLFKATIPETLYEATPQIYRLLLHMSDLFHNTFNAMYKTLSTLALSNNFRLTNQDDFKKSLNAFKNDIKDNIKEKYSMQISEKDKECTELKKRLKELEIENEKLSKSTDKSKMQKLEKRHKEDQKQIRALLSEKNKKEKEYEEQIEILQCINEDAEVASVAEDVVIPDLPEDMKIVFCMQDKPGFEKTAKALTEEFENATIAYSPAQITNQDIVVYLTEMMSHPLYYSYKKVAEKLGCYTWHTMIKNPKLIREKLSAYLYNRREAND